VITAEDITRRVAIAEYRLDGEHPEPDLEDLAELAATICRVSTAVINIIDDRYQHQIAAVGFQAAICAREDSMCAVVFQNQEQVVVFDARVDQRFSNNPFVTGELANVRFYASSPLVTPDGIPIGTLCVFDEETGDLDAEKRRAIDLLAHQVVEVLELRKATRELSQSNEQLAHFAGQIGHDLRNPLMAVSGFLELATDSPEMLNAPFAATVIARAESAASRMAIMITDLLTFAQAGGSQPRREQIDLQSLVSSVVEDLHSAIEDSGATVVVDAPVRLLGDPTLLRALLQNLVANAIKFSAAVGETPLVEIRAQQISAGWRLTVDDNGPGIAPDQRERVFDLMDRGTAHGVSGLGIGLSTCRRIVQAHGGRIGIEDSALGGASVWVVLPD
jgi:signal transduction histidine kinase